MEVTNYVTPETTNAAVLDGNLQDLLKFGILNGTIDVPHLQDEYEMKKNEEILQQHQYKIWQGKNGRWFTYLPTDSGRKLVSKSSEKEVKKEVVKFYRKNVERPKNFISAYEQWRSVQDKMVCNNTISKYDSDRKRYFDNTQFAKLELGKITEEHIKLFIVETIKSQKLCKKSCKTLFGYIRNSIYSARVNKYITEDPMEFLQAKQFYKFCAEKEKSISDNIFSQAELEKIQKQILLDFEKKPNYIPIYAVQLALLTGMRVGEIAALKWEDVKEKYLIINKSEKYDKIEKCYYIDDTKNHKSRVFPITKEILKLLTLLKYVETTNGYLCEWMFANEEGRIHSTVISSCIKNKCKQIGIQQRGIHSFRKTLNSKLKCNGVSTTVAASLLGHTTEVNEQYYTFDVTDLDYKTKVVENIEVV